MRLRRSRLKQYHHKKRIPVRDGEGGVVDIYDAAASFYAEVWPAGGKLQTEMYGERLKYIRNVRIDGKYTVTSDEKGVPHYLLVVGENEIDITEGDGVCIYVSADAEKPDYRIISIRPYRYLKLEVEKLL